MEKKVTDCRDQRSHSKEIDGNDEATSPVYSNMWVNFCYCPFLISFGYTTYLSYTAFFLVPMSLYFYNLPCFSLGCYWAFWTCKAATSWGDLDFLLLFSEGSLPSRITVCHPNEVGYNEQWVRGLYIYFNILVWLAFNLFGYLLLLFICEVLFDCCRCFCVCLLCWEISSSRLLPHRDARLYNHATFIA